MQQNIYDDPDFFKGYMDLRSSERGFNAAIEEPALRGLLPPMDGLRVLDIGCGYGQLADDCLQRGAAHVFGADISRNMIAEARSRVTDKRSRFAVMSAENLELEADAYDLAVSSLCFHYVRDIKPVFENVATALRPDGRFLFSVEHPICTALLRGWIIAGDPPEKYWPVNHYKKETIRHSKWFVDGVIKYHRTVETYVNAFIDAGFSISRLLEPGPGEEAVAERPELADHLGRPPILVISGSLRI